MKILLIGASGYLGSRLYKSLSEKHEVIGTFHEHGRTVRDGTHLNLRNLNEVYWRVQELAPEVIVHAGGMVGTDRCELARQEAEIVNVDATRVIQLVSDAKIVFLSTNYVFDGEKGNYAESDIPNPINHYGFTKLQAEKLVLRNKGNLVLRLSAVYGRNPENDKFYNRFFEEAGVPKKVISGCKDLIFTPTYIEDIVENFPVLMAQEGIVHFSGSEAISEYDFLARFAARVSPETAVEEVSFGEKCAFARRPKNTSLSTERNLVLKRTSLEAALKGIEGGGLSTPAPSP